ncbi:SMC-Scp complex subunit ScpB [Mesoaciditoga sp.]
MLMAARGVTLNELMKLTKGKRAEILEILDDIEEDFSSEKHGVELKNVAGKYAFFTKAQYAESVSNLRRKSVSELTPSQMEVLAIIAKNQPITMRGIYDFKGSMPSSQIKELLSMKMIRRKRDKSSKGHPYVYYTTDEFLKVLGIPDLSFLPKGDLKFENSKVSKDVRNGIEKES